MNYKCLFDADVFINKYHKYESSDMDFYNNFTTEFIVYNSDEVTELNFPKEKKGYEYLPKFIKQLLIKSNYTFYKQSFKIIKSLVSKYFFEPEYNLKCIVCCLDSIIQSVNENQKENIELIDNEFSEILEYMLKTHYCYEFYEILSKYISDDSLIPYDRTFNVSIKFRTVSKKSKENDKLFK